MPPLLCLGKTTSGALHPVLVSPVQDSELLKKVRWRDTKIIRGLDHLPSEERLIDLEKTEMWSYQCLLILFGWGQALLGGSQQQDKGQLAQTGTEAQTNVRNNLFILRVIETGMGCPERMWCLLLWRYSKLTWTLSCVNNSRNPALERTRGSVQPYESVILWFCVCRWCEKHLYFVIIPLHLESICTYLKIERINILSIAPDSLHRSSQMSLLDWAMKKTLSFISNYLTVQ